ncbi:hypothetical protein STEG23_008809, partial [Scotinomys teguina]
TPSNLLEFSICDEAQSMFLPKYEGGVSLGHVKVFPVDDIQYPPGSMSIFSRQRHDHVEFLFECSFRWIEWGKSGAQHFSYIPVTLVLLA